MNRRQSWAIGCLTMALAVLSLGVGMGWTATPMPNPGGTPDYFYTPNWANSPPLRKFVDTLPGLTAAGVNNLGQYIPVAIPDTTTYPGSDYYEIELGEYKEKMHSDMAATTLRGYRQTNTNDASVNKFHYLGPLIIATKDRPVRVKFTNALGTGAAGNLFVPVDTTVMGSGPYAIDYDPTTKAPMALTTGTFAQNRATLHLHGGRTPWISDGTPHQWVTPAGENTTYPKGVSVSDVPDMWFDANGNTIATCATQTTCGQAGANNNPGPGSQTFYWTNQQSSRLMFYHDHSWGITRLNVYVGEAAGYMITDQVEQDLLTAGVIPSEQIPLVIQDKTYVDENTIGATDPTWNWGSKPGMAVDGDLWWPHVYVPAQNPYNPDMSGVNAMGRWHYGPWFWPPTPICGSTPQAVKPLCLSHGPIANPLYDPKCDSTVSATCQPPEIPGAPNPSWGAEAFLDTPIVNGTPYPKLTVQPKSYRFRILNAAHDRFLNLQFYEADGTQTNPACPTCASNTEVKMVAASPRPDCNATLSSDCTCAEGFSPAGCFPATWPTDGREGGVPDPATAGPEWIQIGTEGGFLPQPVVVPNQPVTWNLDPTMFNVGNVNGGSLILGAAERADVIVDFSKYAGKTLILYNDAPTAFPALDPHYDYYTGAPDRTDIGGSPTTPVGLGPNVRTIMQIQVAAANPAPAYDLAALQAKFTSTLAAPGVFEQGQPPIIVGQSAYNSTYVNTTGGVPFKFTDPSATPFPVGFTLWGQSRISDTTLNFQQPDGIDVTNFPMEPKAIHDEMGEVFDDYGRMSAKLGLERPFGNATITTFVMQNFVDPSTEILRDGEVQIWKITHNGVDTHPIHFHLFDVQVINRVGWDGFLRQPDPNELGWKDTVRIAPLEDTIVALRAAVPTVPFRLPDSIRPLNPAQPLGSTEDFSHMDPLTANRMTPLRQNEMYNFGWEYVWHCHILSHEENDMMRSITAVVIDKPTGLATAPGNPAGTELTWTDNSHNETSFTVQRATNAAFTQNVVSFPDQLASQPNTNFGVTLSMTDTTGSAGNQYYYRVQAVNDYGSASHPNLLASTWSDPVATGGKSMGLSPGPLSFGNQLINTVSAVQDITVTNTGNADLTITGITIGGGKAAQFNQTNTCVGTLAVGAICTVSVTFQPTATGSVIAALTVDEADPQVSQMATISGIGVSAVASVSPTIRAFGNQVINTPSLAQLVTVRNTGTSPLTIGNISLAGTDPTLFTQVNTCTAPLTQAASCTINVTFTPTSLGAKSAILDVAGTSVALSGTGIDGPETAVSPAAILFGNQVLTTTSATQTVTLSNPGNQPLTINSISLTGTNFANFAKTTTCGASLAAGANCTVSVTFTPTVLAAAHSALLNVNVAAPANSRSIALSGTGMTGPIATVSQATLPFANQVMNTTSAAQTVTLSNTGSGPLTINNIGLTGADAAHFAQTNTCGVMPATLAMGANCTVSVTFTPAVDNTPLSASLDLSVAAPAVSQTVSLSGTGDTPIPAVAVSLPALSFANQVINTTSAAQTVTISNTGTGALTINSVGLTGADAVHFAQTNTCGVMPATLAVGANCMVSVTFAPTVATTPLSASLAVNVAAPATSQAVTLSGTGDAALPVAAVSPLTLSFTGQLLNTTSAAQTVTVSNTGNSIMTINGIALSGVDAAQFAQTNTCGGSLAVGANCTVSITFAPTVVNTPLNAALDVSVAAPAMAQSVPLSGTGVAPVAIAAPTTLPFGDQLLNSASTAQTVTVSNTGTAPLTINSIGLAGLNSAHFAQTNTCGPTLAAGANCAVSVTFTPTVADTPLSALLNVDVAPPATSQSVALSGKGTLPVVALSAATLAFADQMINTISAPPQTVTVSNTGTGPLTINGVTLAGVDPGKFIRTTTCGGTLAAGANCTVNVSFAPMVAGTWAATLDVNVAAPGVSQSVSLSGTSISPVATASSAALLFGDQILNTTGAAQTVTVSNTGSAPLVINNITLAGSNPGHFAQTNTCDAKTLAVGTNCTVSVQFNPTGAAGAGTQSASLVVNVAAPAANASVTLSGTGTIGAAAATVSTVTLPFATQVVNTTTAAQTVTLSNTGSGPLTINGISLIGVDAAHFAQTNTCGVTPATLAVGANCTVSLTFTPTVVDLPLSAALDVSVAAPAISQSVTLSGMGATAVPVTAVSPAIMPFADQLVNTTSTAQTVTVSNTGNALMTINGIGLTGVDAAHFAQTNTCGVMPATLAIGANCTVSVTLAPTLVDTPLNAALDVSVAAPATSQSIPLSGKGVAPVAAVSPAGVPFGDQILNTTSTAQTVTISNTGSAPLTINSIGLAGLGAVHFAQTNTCGPTLAAGANCTVSTTFTPTVANTPLSALLNVDVAAPALPQSLALSGTGTLPVATLSAATLPFGNQGIYTISAPPQTVTISNTGSGPLTINSISLGGTDPGQFIRTSTCGGTLAAGANCAVDVRFAPQVAGTWAATLDVNVAVPGVSQSVSLSGTGISPLTAVSSTALLFGNQVVNTTGAAQTVTVSNTGTAPLTINNITLTGANANQFAQTNTCNAATLVVGASCTASVTFKPAGPTGAGVQSASLSVNVAAPATNGAVSLSGTGISEPMAAVSPATLPFAGQLVNTTSVVQTVTVSNTGNSPMDISSISLTGVDAAHFAQTSTCGLSLAGGANCTVSVTFTPTVVGTPLSAALDVNVVAPAISQSIPLSGTGEAPGAGISPVALSFGNQLRNTTSTAQTVTVSNTGIGPLTINTIGLAGIDAANFTQTSTCSTTLAAGANCTVSVTFTPTVADTLLSAMLNVDVAAPAVSQSVALSGTGTLPITTLSAATLSFVEQIIYTISAPPQTVTVSNTGSGPLTINSISLGGTDPGQFLRTSTCGGTLAAGANCTVDVRFAPTVAGVLAATLDVSVAAPGISLSVPLSGTGLSPLTTVSPAALSFGNTAVNTSSAAQTVVVSNTGTAPMTINNVTIAGANLSHFAQTNTCDAATLAVGANCTVSVTFTPTGVTGAGLQSALLTVNVAMPASNEVVALDGTGVAGPLATVSPAFLSFGNQETFTVSAARTVTISNTGIDPLTINGISLTGADAALFSQSNTCGATLAAGANCTVSLTYLPNTAGAQSATLAVDVAAPATSQLVPLSGTGTNPAPPPAPAPAPAPALAPAPVAAASPATLSFGNQGVNTSSPAQTITVSNTGAGPLTITSIGLSIANLSQFTPNTTCVGTLAAGESCTINVVFNPTGMGPQSALLNVNVAAPAMSQSISLSGTGTTPLATVSSETLPFNFQLINTASVAKTVTVSNTGNAPLTINGISLGGTNMSQFAQTNTCGATLAAGENCTVSVTFKPTVVGGTQSAVLNVNLAAPGVSKSVALSGTGTSIRIAGTTTSVTYDVANDRFTLPTIETANGIYSADLVMVQSQPTLRFRLENLQVSLIAGPTSAVYEEASTNLLIPSIVVGTQTYMVTMKLVPNLPDIQFELIDAR